MKYRASLAVVLGAGCLTGCSSGGRAGGADLRVGWEVLRNYADERGVRFEAELTLTNKGTSPLPSDNWALYFNAMGRVRPERSPRGIEISHVNGDFNRLTPREGFQPLSPGSSLSWRFTVPGWSISESDAPGGFYLVYRDEQGRELPPEPLPPVSVRPFVTEAQTRRTPGDLVPIPTPEGRFHRNQQVSLLYSDQFSPILPTPVKLQRQPEDWVLDASVEIHHGPELESEARYLAEALEVLLGRPPAVSAGVQRSPRRIVLRTGRLTLPGVGSAESYRLTVGPSGVEIVGNGPSGVFYGIQTLRSWIPAEAYGQRRDTITLDGLLVEDGPRFAYRGLHLDVARNFHSKASVMKLLELMSFYKLNKFHFHITDDEGWRWEVEGLAKLTEVGSRRGHTLDERDRLVPSYGSGPFPDPQLSSGSGYYTRQDLIEILQYAHRRHIEVIPEIDVPGHARAAIKSMEARAARFQADGGAEAAAEYRLVHPEDESEYRSIQGWSSNVVDVCQDSTFRFLGKVFDELIAIYREAKVPLRVVHTGGDEVPSGVWEGSPACRQLLRSGRKGVQSMADLPYYFLRRVGDLLAERNLINGGWEEIGLKDQLEGGHGAKTPNPEFVDRRFQVYVWNSVWGEAGAENGYRLANAGYPVVLCNASNLYFDQAYNKDPQEPGQSWAGYVNTRKPFEFTPLDVYKSAREDYFGKPIAPERLRDATRLTDQGRKQILGIQGQLWSETLVSPERLEYMAFPKMLGLAERAWAPTPGWARLENSQERERALAPAWNRFANSLGQRELPRLDLLLGGVHYRLPLPGAVVEEGKLRANVLFPGLQIRYTTDGSEPTSESALYTGPAAVSGIVKLKTFNTRGRGSRTSVVQ